VAYVAAAFAVVQTAELWLPAVGAADWAVRTVLGVAVLGFPVAIVLAWTCDVSPDGLEKTPEDATADPTYEAGPRMLWAAFVLASITIGALLWTVGR
jgi:adenylate cyclase